VKYYCCHQRIKDRKKLKEGEKRCPAPFVQAQILDERIETKIVRNLLRKPKTALKEWMQETKDQTNGKAALERKIEQKTKQKEARETKIQKLVDAYLEGLFSEKEIRTRKERITVQISLLDKEIQELRDKLKEYEDHEKKKGYRREYPRVKGFGEETSRKSPWNGLFRQTEIDQSFPAYRDVCRDQSVSRRRPILVAYW
jgi:hypothetical protein